MYDALSRVTKVIPPDGSSSENHYLTEFSGTMTTVTDPAGKQRRSYSDALGRIIRVDEPWASSGTPSLSTPAITRYFYDALDNLLCAMQQGGDTGSPTSCSGAQSTWRKREFTYNSLGQVTQSVTPEGGTLTYTYQTGSGVDGLLASVADGRSISTSFTYDALHRVTAKNYSDSTPDFTYSYDQTSDPVSDPISNGKGRLTHVTDGSYQYRTYSYDSMGRLTTQWECLPSNCATGSYRTDGAYDLVGSLTALKYPSSRELKYTYNSAGQLTTVNFDKWAGATVNVDYFKSATYGPAGVPANWTLGNNLVEALVYNSRVQPCRINVKSGSAASLTCTDDAPSGNVLDLKYGFDQDSGSPVKNNGQVASWSAAGAQSWTRTFEYDHVNRLKTLSSSGLNMAWEYDPWGNRTKQTLNSNDSTWGYDNNNRNNDTGFSFDAAGNMTAQPGNITFQWGAANRLKSIDTSGPSYTYDANGLRVKKQVGSAWTEYAYFGAMMVAERNESGYWTDYIFAGGRRVAVAPATPSNSGFEGGSTGWFGWGGGDSIVTDASKAHSGSKYLQLSTSSQHVGFMNGQVVTVIPGEQITLGGWAYRESGSGGYVHWAVEIKNSSGTPFAWCATEDVSAAQWTYKTTACTVPSGGASARFYAQVYDAPGAVTARFDDGFLMAGARYYHTDHLGSTRLMTDAAGATITSANYDYQPFGEMITGSSDTTTKMKFTGLEQDTASGEAGLAHTVVFGADGVSLRGDAFRLRHRPVPHPLPPVRPQPGPLDGRGRYSRQQPLRVRAQRPSEPKRPPRPLPRFARHWGGLHRA